MTLRELLEKNSNAKRPYKYVKIGSQTNFMYCGVPDTYNCEFYESAEDGYRRERNEIKQGIAEWY